MSFKNAAETILRRAGKALHYEEITRLAVEEGMIVTAGKTPASTMIARLGGDVGALKERSRFIKIAPGVFGLNPNAPPPKEKPRLGSANGKPGRIGFEDKPVDWNEVVEYLRRVCRKEVWNFTDEEQREELFSELIVVASEVNNNHREMAETNPLRFWRILKSAVRRQKMKLQQIRRKVRSTEIIPGNGDAMLVLDSNMFVADVPEAQAQLESRVAREEANARFRLVPRVIVRRKSKYFRLADEDCQTGHRKMQVIRIPEDSPIYQPIKYPSGMTALWMESGAQRKSAVSFNDAAEMVLRQAGKALHYAEITKIAIRDGLISSAGKTPDHTMIARLSKDGSRFCKVAPGRFWLTQEAP